MNSQNYRLQVWYSGRVQGVGFRWKAAETAKGYDVCGYVENLDDGRVHLCAKGEKSEVRAFADRLAEYDIPVFEIRPGIIRTDMTAAVAEKYDKLIAEGLTPTRRWGDPIDIARIVVSISQGNFDYSTGQVFDVDGGFHLRRL